MSVDDIGASSSSSDLEPVARFHHVVHQGLVLKERGLIGRVMRSAALRFMRPYIAYQEQVNAAGVEAVEAMQERMTAYQVDLAQTLAELRRAEARSSATPE